MRTKILPYSTQCIDKKDLLSVNKILLSKNLTKEKKTKFQIVNFFKKKGIIINTHCILLNYFSYIRNFISKKRYKNCEMYYKQAISIPIYPHLTRKEQDYII